MKLKDVTLELKKKKKKGQRKLFWSSQFIGLKPLVNSGQPYQAIKSAQYTSAQSKMILRFIPLSFGG